MERLQSSSWAQTLASLPLTTSWLKVSCRSPSHPKELLWEIQSTLIANSWPTVRLILVSFLKAVTFYPSDLVWVLRQTNRAQSCWIINRTNFKWSMVNLMFVYCLLANIGKTRDTTESSRKSFEALSEDASLSSLPLSLFLPIHPHYFFSRAHRTTCPCILQLHQTVNRFRGGRN